MTIKVKYPSKLYKYRDFSARTVELLCHDAIYFADPNTFNDPLDCRPSVEADSDVGMLRRVLQTLVQRRVASETSAAIAASGIQGPKATDHVRRRSEAAAQRKLDDIAYHATNPDYEEDAPKPEVRLLTDQIELELLRQHGRGVCSFGSRYDNPLLWSHYGDQHRGLCIGYSPTKWATPSLHQVAYGGSRKILTSLVAAMVLDGDETARSEIDAAVLLRKAPAWRYEREWRLLGPRGRRDSSLELSEVVFGLRCDSALVHVVAGALKSKERSVDFYEMYEVPGTFRIKRRRVDEDELGAHFPHRALWAQEALDAFDPVDDDDSSVGRNPS